MTEEGELFITIKNVKSALLHWIIFSVANVPEIISRADLINRMLHTDYLDHADINEFEHIREKLRDLIKYIPHSKKYIYITNFDETVLDTVWKEAELESDDLKNYKAKAEYGEKPLVNLSGKL